MTELTPCRVCGGKGHLVKPVFPNTFKKVPCLACREREQRILARAKELGLTDGMAPEAAAAILAEAMGAEAKP